MNRDHLIAAISLHIARSNWWTTYANTAHNKGRIVTDGGGKRYTADDLVQNAMQTADAHLRNAQEALDQLSTLDS